MQYIHSKKKYHLSGISWPGHPICQSVDEVRSIQLVNGNSTNISACQKKHTISQRNVKTRSHTLAPHQSHGASSTEDVDSDGM